MATSQNTAHHTPHPQTDNLREWIGNPTLEYLRNRRSIRKYKDIPLDWEIIGELLYAGRDAPSAGNLQARKFIVITDQAKRKAVAEACFHQYWIATAPLLIVIVAEPEKLARFYGVRGERFYSIQECAVAAQNIIIAAQSLGLGSCFVSAFDEEDLRAVLKIPQFSRPQVVVTIGYPDEIVPEPPKYQLWDITYLQSYGTKIRDIELYIGYNWGRDIAKAVTGLGEKIQKSGEQLEKGVSSLGSKLASYLKGEKK
ncbi:MAG: nitroreductase family protein [Candidatus Woesearchaeota archaeon]